MLLRIIVICILYVRIFVVVVKKSAVRPLKQQQQQNVRKMWTRKVFTRLTAVLFLFIYFLLAKPKSTHTRYTIHIYIYRILWFSYWMWRGWMDGIKFICDCKHSVRFRLFPFFLTFYPYGFWSRICGTHSFLALCFWYPKANCFTLRACFSQVVFYLF